MHIAGTISKHAIMSDQKEHPLMGSAIKAPKVRNIQAPTSSIADRLKEIAVEEPIVASTPEPQEEKKTAGGSSDGDFGSMVDAEDLLAKLNSEKAKIARGEMPGEEAEDVEYESVNEQPGEAGHKEKHILEILLEDPAAVWETWAGIRISGHTIAYDRIVERPLNMREIKEYRDELSLKVRTKTATEEEDKNFWALDDYIKKVNEMGAGYLDAIKYNDLLNKIGTIWLENKLMKLNMSGKRINSDLLFLGAMAAKEADSIAKLYEISRNIPKVELV